LCKCNSLLQLLLGACGLTQFIARFRVVVRAPVLESLLFCPKSQFIALNSPRLLVKNDDPNDFLSAVFNNPTNHGVT
jgi:hypothetical protein